MEESYTEQINALKEKRNTFFYIIIVEVITIALIFASLICMKYFFKIEYKKFDKWYQNSFLCETDMKEVLGEIKK